MADTDNPFSKYAPANPFAKYGTPSEILGAAAEAIDPSPFISGTGRFVGALPQGVIGIPEAIYQLGEHTIGLPRPTGAVPDLLRRYRDWADSTKAGAAGETVGNIGTFIAGGELADLLGLGGKVLPQAVTDWAATHPGTTTLARTAGESAIAQPASGDRFWTEKGEQTGLGALLGRILARPAQRAGYEAATSANREATAAHQQTAEWDKQANEIAATTTKQDYATTKDNIRQANEIAAKRAAEQSAADVAATKAANERDLQAIRDANAADLATHKDLVAGDVERHQTLSEAQQQFHTGEREKAQAAAGELSRRKQAALDARDLQREAKLDVPAQTTQGWWQRTGARIGENVPTDAKADTGALVQDRVAKRLNSLTDRMNLDPADTSLTEELKEISRTTRQGLQTHNQADFFNQPTPTPLERIVHDPNAPPGTMVPRLAERAPPPPTGKWADRVLDPLKKGPLTGRKLTEYITSLGNEANTLATRARASAPGSPEAADLLAQATAYRRAQDTVIGHAAGGNAEDKLALEQARQAYMMWGVGNDAAKASRGGVANPSQLIDMMTKRLGEAKYKQALADPSSPFHDELNWLQQQRDAHAVRVPRDRDVTRPLGEPPPIPPMRPTPIPRPSARTPPTPRPEPTPRDMPQPRQPTVLGYPAEPQPSVIPAEPPPTQRPVPTRPNYRRRDYPGAAIDTGLSAILFGAGHPYGGTLAGLNAVRALARKGAGREGGIERQIRRVMSNPHTARAARAVLGSAGAQADKLRQGAAKLPAKAQDAANALSNMYYRWRGNQ